MENIESTDDLAPDFKDEREHELFNIAQQGLAAQQFMDSQIGRYVVNRMNDVIEVCAHSLLTARTMDEVQALQVEADVAETAIKWIVEVIAEGEVAYQQLQEN